MLHMSSHSRRKFLHSCGSVSLWRQMHLSVQCRFLLDHSVRLSVRDKSALRKSERQAYGYYEEPIIRHRQATKWPISSPYAPSQTGGLQSQVPFSAKCGQTVLCTDSLGTYHHPTQQYYRRPLGAPLPQKGIVMPSIGRVVRFPHLVPTKIGGLIASFCTYIHSSIPHRYPLGISGSFPYSRLVHLCHPEAKILR